MMGHALGSADADGVLALRRGRAAHRDVVSARPRGVHGQVRPHRSCGRGLAREMLDGMNKAIGLHEMRPVVDRVFGFSELRQALEYLKEARHVGKVCLRASTSG
jgi:NADPH:quinone reductase-like Zn-dependent oxidoreductase